MGFDRTIPVVESDGGGGGVKAHAGDRIVVESERATQPPRKGVVEEVIAEDPPRLRIRWDDGHTTVFSPAAGALSIEEATKTN
jgi:Domain of unknown function (DUF1918)